MNATKNPNGLYELALLVKGKKRQKTVRALIDTGSTDCVCTYKVITTLQIKNIGFDKVRTIDSEKKHLIYAAGVGFDGESILVPIIRVEKIADDGDFIIGMSILSKCTIDYDGDVMHINWKK
jgi:hypothetical protein